MENRITLYFEIQFIVTGSPFLEQGHNPDTPYRPSLLLLDEIYRHSAGHFHKLAINYDIGIKGSGEKSNITGDLKFPLI